MSAEIFGKLIHIEEVLAFLLGDSYLPKRSACKYMGMSARKLEGLGIESYRVGSMVYFKRSVLDRFMQSHTEIRAKKPEPAGGLRGLLEAAKKRALAEEKNM